MAGRFVEVDPIVQLGFRQSPNTFAYVWSNPLTLIDSTGFTEDFPSCGPQDRNGICSFPDLDGGTTGMTWAQIRAILELLSGRGGVSFGGAGGVRPGGGGAGSEGRDDAASSQGDFHYKVHDFAFCSANELFSQFSKPDSSALGAPAAVPGTTPDVVLAGGNPITQFVDAGARTITNVTQVERRYHRGTVEIRISPMWFGSRVSIEGRGTGPHYWENRLLGSALFSALAAKATISCTFGAK